MLKFLKNHRLEEGLVLFSVLLRVELNPLGGRDFPGSPVVRMLPLLGARVRSLVGELGSCMLRGTAEKKKKKTTMGESSF